MNQPSGQETSKSKFNWFWPNIKDTESAVKASRGGVWAALISVGVSTIIILFGMITGNRLLGFDAWSFIDAGILLVVAWFIQYRKSRAATVFGLVFFVVNNLSSRIMYMQTSGFLVSLTLTLMWVNAVRGTFAYHRFRRAETGQGDEPAGPSLIRRVGIGAGILVLIGFLGLVLIGILGPPAGVVTWEEVSPRHQRILTESGLLADEDRVVYLYSTGLIDMLDDLYILTEDAVMIYETVDGARQDWVVPLDTIKGLRVAYSESSFEDSGLVVEGEEYLHVVPLSIDGGMDRQFVAKLEQLTGLTAEEIGVGDPE